MSTLGPVLEEGRGNGIFFFIIPEQGSAASGLRKVWGVPIPQAEPAGRVFALGVREKPAPAIDAEYKLHAGMNSAGTRMNDR